MNAIGRVQNILESAPQGNPIAQTKQPTKMKDAVARCTSSRDTAVPQILWGEAILPVCPHGHELGSSSLKCPLKVDGPTQWRDSCQRNIRVLALPECPGQTGLEPPVLRQHESAGRGESQYRATSNVVLMEYRLPIKGVASQVRGRDPFDQIRDA